MDIDLEKLRRFCLTSALVLTTYLWADITLATNQAVTILGVPMTVKRSDLLPAGLAMACLLGALRFIYYGFLRTDSPYRIRRDRMNRLIAFSGSTPGKIVRDLYGDQREMSADYELSQGDTVLLEELPQYTLAGKHLWMYFGQSEIRLRRLFTDPLRDVSELVDAFPKYRNARASIDNSAVPGREALLTIPFRCRTSALFEDLDYSAPVWLNAFALLLYEWPSLKRLWVLATVVVSTRWVS